jgi:class 3 adenylate cyclase/tetratricopeptide (TPR) repeat protein
MKCGNCNFENQENAVFCGGCGISLEPDIACSNCGTKNSARHNFCNKCGNKLIFTDSRPDAGCSAPSLSKVAHDFHLSTGIIGERKHVTVLFSDMTGYTSMGDMLDPEEVKEITGGIFQKIADIVQKYEGFIEKYIGDAIVAIFGASKSSEDDPVRAIKAAIEIHEFVLQTSPGLQSKIGQPISMHSGIHTGLVVTGEINFNTGTHGISGDTINLAARFSSLAKAGEILVGQDTFTQTSGYFNFDILGPVSIKGKSDKVPVFRFDSIKDQPQKFHRLQGVKSQLIGRKLEISRLNAGLQKILGNKGITISICGAAGCGKSRLIEDFKTSLDLNEIQWIEGHAYPYAQNTPYFPLINMLNRTFRINEGDMPGAVKEKLETGLSTIFGSETEFIPYIGRLYSLDYPEIEDVSPDFWHRSLQKSIVVLLSKLAEKKPMVICLEDLHWADPSFLNLIQFILSNLTSPILTLAAYRPPIRLFSDQQIKSMINSYEEIMLQDLSASESQEMIESLLKTGDVPDELQQFVREKIEGNPFYIEELINKLIEDDILVLEDGTWRVEKNMSTAEISSTIQGVIASRLDHIETESKRILQEASVIGRAFYYQIINRITAVKENVDQYLSVLERLDLIKTKSIQPDIEYMFKHALTQEVVYNGLLKKERIEIHEQIGLVMEALFHNRVHDFSETLAFHFLKGKSHHKAVKYLIISGEKSYKKYAVDEAHQHFKLAYNIVCSKFDQSHETEKLKIQLIVKWAFVYYFRGDFRNLETLLQENEKAAHSTSDLESAGMFFAFQGMTALMRSKFETAYQVLQYAYTKGVESDNSKVMGYASTWLSWVCCDMGLFEKGIAFGKKGNTIAHSLKSDHYLYYKSLAGIAHNYFQQGEARKCIELGKKIVAYGQKHSHIRSLVLGHLHESLGYWIADDYPRASECARKAIQVSIDPFYTALSKYCLANCLMRDKKLDQAEIELEAMGLFSFQTGCRWIGDYVDLCSGVIQMKKGALSKGMNTLNRTIDIFEKQGRRIYVASGQMLLGTIYLEMATGEKKPMSPLALLKNAGFILQHVIAADTKAEKHLKKAVEISEGIGQKSVFGFAILALARFYQTKKENEAARIYLEQACRLFSEQGRYRSLEKAKDMLLAFG